MQTKRKANLNLELTLFTIIRAIVHSAMRMVYPFLPEFARGLGVDLLRMSQAVTIRNFTSILVPFITAAFDHYGRRSGMLTGVGLFMLGCVVVFIFPVFPVFIIALCLTFIGMHVFASTMHSYQADTIPFEARGRAMVITGYGWGLSLAVVVPLLGLLVGRYGWQSPFLVLGAMGLISAGALWYLVPAGAHASKRPESVKSSGIIQVLVSRTAIAGLLMTASFCAGNEVVSLFYGVWLEDTFGLDIASLGAASIVIGVSELVCVALLGGIVDRLGAKRSVGIGLILSTMSALALPLLGSLGSRMGGRLDLWVVEVWLFFFSLTFQVQFMASTPLLADVLPGARAALIGASMAAVGLGRMAGSMLAPLLYVHGFEYNTFTAAGFYLLALAALLAVKVQAQTLAP